MQSSTHYLQGAQKPRLLLLTVWFLRQVRVMRTAMRVYSRFLGAITLVGTVGACSSSPSSNTRDAANPLDGGSTCNGTVVDGILGTWGITRLAGGDAPGGVTVVAVKGTYRFCGSPSSGTFRYTDDGLHTPGRNCHLIRELDGSFTYDSATLAMTTTSGFFADRNCDDPSLNLEQQVNGPSTTSYPAAISGSELTIQDGSVSGGQPGSVYARE